MAAAQLPTELLAAIFEPLSPVDLAAAAAVCWRFNGVAERLLYANVHIIDLLSEGPSDRIEPDDFEGEEDDYSEEGSEGMVMSGDEEEEEDLSGEEDEEEGYSSSDYDEEYLYDQPKPSRKEALSMTPWRTLRWATSLRRRAYLWDSVRRVHVRWQALEDGRSPTHSPSHSHSQLSESETRREREAEAQRRFGLHQNHPAAGVYAQDHERRRDEEERRRRQEELFMQYRRQQHHQHHGQQPQPQQRRHREPSDAAAGKQRRPSSSDGEPENPLVDACDRLGSILSVLTALESLELFLGPANFIRVRLPASVVSPVPADAFATHRVLETHSYRQPLAFPPQQQSFIAPVQEPQAKASESVPLLHAIERVVQACAFPNLRSLALGVDSQPKTASSSPTQSSASLVSHYVPSPSPSSSYALNVPYSPYTLNAAPYSPYTSYASSSASTSSSGASPYAFAGVYPYASAGYPPPSQQHQAAYTLRQPAYSGVLPAFLARLPQLTHLRIAASSSSSSSAYFDADGGDSGLTAALAKLPPNALPALQSFRGSARAAARLVPGRTIMQLALAGRDEDVMGSNWAGTGAGATMMMSPGTQTGAGAGALPLLAQGSVPLRVLDLSAMSARPTLLRSVAQVLTTLECLRVKLALRHTLHYSFSGIRMLAPLANVLSLLPNLTFLDLAPTGVDGFGSADPQSAGGHDTEERALCAEWARACPSLRRVIFPSQSDWVKDADGMMDADSWTLAVTAES